jgi:hypothetical protein
MKNAALMLVAIVCFVLLIKSLFHSGRVALFGIPVSGLIFVVILKAIWSKIDE